MSASKSKQIDKLNEPAPKKAAPKKTVKKAPKKAKEAVMEDYTEARRMINEPVVTYEAKENISAEALLEKFAKKLELLKTSKPVVVPEPVIPVVEVEPTVTIEDQFTDNEPEPEETKPTFLHSVATFKYWSWVAAFVCLVVLAGLFYGLINGVKKDKAEKIAQQKEQKTQARKDSLAQTGRAIEIRHREVDAELEEAAQQFNKAMANYKEFHAKEDLGNTEYKKQNNEMQSRIFDTVNNSNDARRQRGRELSGQK